MRNVFLALLLANLLFLGWRLWVAPEEVPADRLMSAGPDPKIAVLESSRAGTRPEQTAEPVDVTTGAGAKDGLCVRVGPIGDGQMADTLRARLTRDGIAARAVSEEGEIWVGHWVQLESVASRDEADRIVTRLAAGGLPDAYVLQTSPPFSISLGVFRDRERADKVATTAASLGFRPQTTDRYRSGRQYWLSVALPPGRALPMNELGRESGQILRAEPVPCAPDSVGGTGAIN